MNEDERGITPADVTAITIESETVPGEWLVTIEQGNGAVIKQIQLTEMERVQLAAMICTEPLQPVQVTHLSFVDFGRAAKPPAA